MTVLEQSLFDADTIQLAWERFDSRHPEVFSEMVRIVAQAKDRGDTYVSIKWVFESIRCKVPREGKPVALNNNWTAPAARQLIARRPDLAPLIKIRKRTALFPTQQTDS